jgi:colicin import membrane protein
MAPSKKVATPKASTTIKKDAAATKDKAKAAKQLLIDQEAAKANAKAKKAGAGAASSTGGPAPKAAAKAEAGADAAAKAKAGAGADAKPDGAPKLIEENDSDGEIDQGKISSFITGMKYKASDRNKKGSDKEKKDAADVLDAPWMCFCTCWFDCYFVMLVAIVS